VIPPSKKITNEILRYFRAKKRRTKATVKARISMEMRHHAVTNYSVVEKGAEMGGLAAALQLFGPRA